MYISEIRTKAPADERMPLERKFYDTLEKLKIPYEQVDNDPASSMEECAEVDKAIGTEIRKNVFLCNQKKTTFFLLVMPADKAFDTSSFSKKLGVSHMSFAPPEKMLEQGVKINGIEDGEFRFVTTNDTSREDIDRALDIFESIIRG